MQTKRFEGILKCRLPKFATGSLGCVWSSIKPPVCNAAICNMIYLEETSRGSVDLEDEEMSFRILHCS